MKQYRILIFASACYLSVGLTASESQNESQGGSRAPKLSSLVISESPRHKVAEADSDSSDSDGSVSDFSESSYEDAHEFAAMFEFESPEDRLKKGMEGLPKYWKEQALQNYELRKSKTGCMNADLAKTIVREHKKMARDLAAQLLSEKK